MSVNHPTARGSFHFLSGRAFRPCRQLMRMGIPYDKSSATTDAEIIALNALIGQLGLTLSKEIIYLEEPRKIHPKQMTTTTVKMRALRGN